MNDDVELAYLAGAMDADGFFAIRLGRKGNSVSYFETMGLGQVSPIVPTMLKQRFGGSVQIRKRTEPAAVNWRVMYYWLATTRVAARATAELQPYLRLKTHQADLLLALRESKNLPYSERRKNHVGVRAYTTDPAIQAQRRSLFEEMIKTNRTGVH